MSDVTQILQAVEAGDEEAVGELMPLIYQELKILAAARLFKEGADDSLQTTGLVHEAYLRLFGGQTPSFRNRAHFFGAASEAMRRVLIDRARRRLTAKRGAEAHRVNVDPDQFAEAIQDKKLLRLHDVLEKLENVDADKAKLVKLRFFAGLPIREAADMMGISTATADRQWRFTRAWLQREMGEDYET